MNPSPEGDLLHGTIGLVAETRAWRHGDQVYTYTSFGRVVDHLAARFSRVILSLPIADAPPAEAGDYVLAASNIEIIPQPFYLSSLAALRRPIALVRAYWRICRRADHIFVRGMLPYSGLFYIIARANGRRPCHWIIGDPVALLRSHRRAGALKDVASLAYARFDRACTRIGNRLAGGSFICNGRELGQVYRSPRTHVTVSSTVTEDEFFVREDTCQGPVVTILFVGFIRPEKGVEYLFKALGKLRTERPWKLVVVGGYEQYGAYYQRLMQQAEQLGIAERLSWQGYACYGQDLFRHLRSADVFVLPTLSEGTPRVLVEARANSLPLIATAVGGIPTSVVDGVDGLLVPPKNAGALAAAIDRVVADGELRRRMISNGLNSARRLTVDRFVDLVTDVLTGD